MDWEYNPDENFTILIFLQNKKKARKQAENTFLFL